jgi:creatinine deaminase
MRVQKGSAIHHVSRSDAQPNRPNSTLQGETAALENSGRLPASAYKGATMFTTLSPCDMCTGACLLYGISRVVIGENKTFLGGEAYLKSRGVEVVVMENEECKELMEKFIREKPEVWM